MAFGQQVTIQHQVPLSFTVGPHKLPVSVTALVANHPLPHPIQVGLPALRQLPLAITLDGETIFSGFANIKPIEDQPSHAPGEGIQFSGGSPAEQAAVTQLVMQYKDLFYEYTGKYGLLTSCPADLQVTDPTPTRQLPFSQGPVKAKAMQEITQEYLHRGLIEPSTSPYAAPAFLVTKKCSDPNAPASRRFRMVEDYRLLNQKLLDVNYPVHAVQQLIDNLPPNVKFLCKLDFRMGYHHCPLTQRAKALTAFITPAGHYQYKVLPFGLKTAPRIFQQAMERILAKHLGIRCLIYLDDVLVFGSSFNNLLHNLEQIFQTLLPAGASLNLTKCQFLATELEYLGFQMGQSGYSPTPTSVSAIKSYPRPTTLTQLRRFLGLVSYIRRFIPHCAQYEARLRTAVPDKATAKQTILQWTPDATTAFTELRDAISHHTQVARFDPDKSTLIMADASATGLGAVLVQFDKQGQPHVVEFASRILTAVERRYSNSERELLALVWATAKQFRRYVEGVSFQLGTDHQALLGNIKARDNSARMVRLLMQLEPFTYTLQHIPGVAMTVADALSRAQQVSRGPLAAGCSLTTTHLPSATEIINLHLHLGHANPHKVAQHLQPSYPLAAGLQQFVHKVLASCDACRVYNVPTSQGQPMLSSVSPTRRSQIYALDVVPMVRSTKGHRYCAVLIDIFSRRAFVRPLNQSNTRTLIWFLKQIFLAHGTPEELITDSDPIFLARKFATFMEMQHINHHVTDKGHATGNAHCERLVRTLKAIQVKSGHPPHHWSTSLPAAASAYNRTLHSAHGFSPLAVWSMTAADDLATVRSRLQAAAATSLEPLNCRRHELQPGMFVWLQLRRPAHLKHNINRHFLPRKQGPYMILQILPENRVLLGAEPPLTFLTSVSSLRLFKRGGE